MTPIDQIRKLKSLLELGNAGNGRSLQATRDFCNLIFEISPELLHLWETHEAWANAEDGDKEQIEMGKALDALNTKAAEKVK